MLVKTSPLLPDGLNKLEALTDPRISCIFPCAAMADHGRRFTQNTLEKQTNLEISPNFKSVRHPPPPVTVLVKSETEDTSPRTVMSQLKHKVANGPSTNVVSFDVCFLPGRLHVFQVTELKTASARTARYLATCAQIVVLSKRVRMDSIWK